MKPVESRLTEGGADDVHVFGRQAGGLCGTAAVGAQNAQRQALVHHQPVLVPAHCRGAPVTGNRPSDTSMHTSVLQQRRICQCPTRQVTGSHPRQPVFAHSAKVLMLAIRRHTTSAWQGQPQWLAAMAPTCSNCTDMRSHSGRHSAANIRPATHFHLSAAMAARGATSPVFA